MPINRPNVICYFNLHDMLISIAIAHGILNHRVQYITYQTISNVAEKLNCDIADITVYTFENKICIK